MGPMLLAGLRDAPVKSPIKRAASETELPIATP